jgi:hypothetical protein
VVTGLALVLVLAMTGGLVNAGDSGPTGQVEPQEAEPQSLTAEDVQNYIPVQGRLTDASGNPLNGDYPIAFRLYDVNTGGTALCVDTNLVKVVKGLFSSEVYGNCVGVIYGEQLYLSIEVNGTGEMDPRLPIYAVPYAWSLRPGARIIGSVGPDAMLHIENTDPSGRGLRAYAMSTSGVNYGIVGAAVSPDGFGAYIYNSGGGTALKAESNTGAAIKSTGTRVIQSSASSYVWISGNGLRPYLQSYDTIIDMDTIGGAKVTRGAAAGTRNVMLLITITGPLYGQDVKVTGMDVYFLGDTASDGITTTLLRRQKGMCSTSSCYATILFDSTLYSCDDAVTPSGCTHHWDLTENNSLTSSSGVLYLTFELEFNGATSWVDIGGVRLTLEHD